MSEVISMAALRLKACARQPAEVSCKQTLSPEAARDLFLDQALADSTLAGCRPTTARASPCLCLLANAGQEPAQQWRQGRA